MASPSDDTLVRLVSALTRGEGREAAARALAARLGAEDIVVFVRDEEVGAALPAPGFPQTLPEGRAWRAFLEECARSGCAVGDLASPFSSERRPTVGLAAPGGTVLALLGGSPKVGELVELEPLLELLGAALRGEQSRLAADALAVVTRQAGERAEALAEALAGARSELERALEAAQAANRAKDEFLATVSHELRTPLNAMLGWVRMLRSGRVDDAVFRRGLETIERNVLSQAQLVEDLLDVSRIVSGRLRLDVRPVDLPALVSAALDSVRPAADARSVAVDLEIDRNLAPVSGDAERLQQVFWNLLSNAIKFTPEGGRVTARVARRASGVEVSVRDTGKGIGPEFLPYVFDRFRQADESITRKHGGLGLGLSIVRHLVELHGGTVGAESPGEGLGSTFTVRLPALDARRSSAARPSPPPRSPASVVDCPPDIAGIRVLLVEDDADSRDMLSTALEQCAAEVFAVGSATEALEAVDCFAPAVIVSDIGLPGIDGYELIRSLRARGPQGRGAIPAVALTAFARSEDRIKALAAGFQMHLAKPVEPSELVLMIHTLVEIGRRLS